MEAWCKEIMIAKYNSDLYVEKAVLEALKAEERKSFVMKALIVKSEARIKALEELLDKINR